MRHAYEFVAASCIVLLYLRLLIIEDKVVAYLRYDRGRPSLHVLYVSLRLPPGPQYQYIGTLVPD